MTVNKFSMGELEIIIENGFAIDKSVDAVINSANNGLLLGASGAGKIRDVTGYLPVGSHEEKEFYWLCNNTGNIGVRCPEWLEKQNKENKKKGKPKTGPTYVQLECLREIHGNNGKPFALGDAIMTSSGTLANDISKPTYIIHAVGMGYTWPNKETKGDLIPATPESIRTSLSNSLVLVNTENISSLALPLMAVRKSHEITGEKKEYGLTPEESYSITLDVLSKAHNPKLKKAIICADNSESREYFKNLGGRQ